MNIRSDQNADALPEQATMSAVTLDRFGGVDELTLRQVPVPKVGDNDVLIQVVSAGVGSWDAIERQGHYDSASTKPVFPYILGGDGAGTVAAIGGNITQFALGDRVYAASLSLPRGGFYAEYAVVAAKYVAHIPDKIPIDQAGAMPWDALTALSGLEALNVAPGESLMIFGASGGIGHMALQLAQTSNIRIFAVASGDDGVDLANRLGANAVVDGHKHDVVAAASQFAPDGLDAALLTAGGPVAEHALTALKASGRIACPNGVVPVRTPSGTQLSLYNGDRSQAGTRKLNAFIKAHPFEVHLANVFPFENVRDAHRALATHYVGKIALRVA